ncbi:MAG: DNA-processing protein DprA [Parabacteroides sp.]|nr:DNA-processing protein DprA [Parabacteroides sp.]
MTGDKLLYRIALTMIKGVGDTTARQLLEITGSEEAVFTEKRRALASIPGISNALVTEILRPEVLEAAEQELAFIEKNRITPYFFTDSEYPFRLKECADAPLLLYFKGEGRLDAAKVISVVGTRHATEYGRELTGNLIAGLSACFPDLLVVSGLAYGIDIQAHRSALQHRLPTVGVLAHGLDRIYPGAHRRTAVEMLERGGLLTDFPSGTNPDRANFVKRNRIVAGLADATVVVESAEKGGSLITADLAFSYGRDVYAFPGRVTDGCSCGCHALIRGNKAGLITSAADLIEALCWERELQAAQPPVQGCLCFDLTADEEPVVALLRETGEAQVNQLAVTLHCPICRLSPVLFGLEMKGVVKSLPGGRYKLIGG